MCCNILKINSTVVKVRAICLTRTLRKARADGQHEKWKNQFVMVPQINQCIGNTQSNGEPCGHLTMGQVSLTAVMSGRQSGLANPGATRRPPLLQQRKVEMRHDAALQGCRGKAKRFLAGLTGISTRLQWVVVRWNRADMKNRPLLHKLFPVSRTILQTSPETTRTTGSGSVPDSVLREQASTDTQRFEAPSDATGRRHDDS